MRVYVIYDVHEEYESVRNKLREKLKDFGGIFVEYSVYVTDLNSRDLSRMLKIIRTLIRGSKARVDIILPCSKCLSRIKIIGISGEGEIPCRRERGLGDIL